jgi:uncharacterized protein with HEPN domain
MDERSRKLLWDIQTAGSAIQQFCRGRTKMDFAADLLLRSAVERQYEIIGEALRRLQLADVPLFARIPEGRRIIGFRNVLAHAYDTIDDAITWDIVQHKWNISCPLS